MDDTQRDLIRQRLIDKHVEATRAWITWYADTHLNETIDRILSGSPRGIEVAGGPNYDVENIMEDMGYKPNRVYFNPDDPQTWRNHPQT